MARARTHHRDSELPVLIYTLIVTIISAFLLSPETLGNLIFAIGVLQ